MPDQPTTLWFVTFVTQNSRVSDRMERISIKPGPPVVFSPGDQVTVAQDIIRACERHRIALVAVNVLPDHVHMIVSAPSEAELTEHVRKIKGSAAHALRSAHGWTSPRHIWARKFNRRAIRDEASLRQMTTYVLNNHLKHADRWGTELVRTWETRIRPLVDAGCVSVADVFS